MRYPIIWANDIATSVPAGLDVDIEYNRHGNKTKYLKLLPRKALDRGVFGRQLSFHIFLIHKRDADENNILVLELKKPSENLDL